MIWLDGKVTLLAGWIGSLIVRIGGIMIGWMGR